MKYYCIDDDETLEDAREIPEKFINRWKEYDSTIDMIARFDYRNSDGDLANPDSWPRTYVLVGDDGVESRWSVSMEYSPYFDACKVEEAKA